MSRTETPRSSIIGSVVLAVVLEARRHVLVAVGQGQPGLDAEQAVRAARGRRGGALGMGDAAPGDHPVQRAGTDDLVGAGAVAVMEVAAIEVGDGAEADMRVRPDVDALSGQELGRPGLVEEDERPDHLPLRRRQGAPDLEAAEVAGARNDERLDRVEPDLVGAARFDCWVPTHARHPRRCRRRASSLPTRLPVPVQSSPREGSGDAARPVRSLAPRRPGG